MKQRFYFSLLALFIATAATLPAATAQPVDGIVAVVNQDVILASELASAVKQTRIRMGPRADDIPIQVLRSKALDQLIFKRLQLQKAQQLGISVNEQDIARGLARLAQKNGMSTQQFIQAVKSRGMSMAALRARLKQTLLIQKVRRQQVMDKVVITNQDVTQFLESRALRNQHDREYHIRHIRIDVPADASTATVKRVRKQIEHIRSRITSGDASFAALAKQASDGDNAARGGDMGWIGSAFMPKVFIDIVPSLQPGEVSRVFRGAGAFHLVKLLDVRGSQNLAGGQKVMVDEIKVQHIVLKPNALRNRQQTRALAHELLERLQAGANFADLAREYSDDKVTANQGGQLGWIQPQQLGPREAVQVARMQPGNISPVLQTNHGYIIVKVSDRRQRDKTREAIRRRARQILGQRQSQEKGRRWLQKLRAQAYVDIRLPGYQSTTE